MIELVDTLPRGPFQPPTSRSGDVLERSPRAADIQLLDQHRVAELVRPIAPRVERRVRLGQRARRRGTRAAAGSGCCRVRACPRGWRRRSAAGWPDRCAGPRSRHRHGRRRRARRRARAHARPWCRRRRSGRPPPWRGGSRPPSLSGMRYGSSNGSRRSSSGSPVDEMPAASVMVANTMPRSRIARIDRQSSAKPADGGSNAAGSAGDRRPDVPHRERRRHVRVLDRPAVPREAGPHRVGRTVEAQRHEPRMIEQRLDVAERRSTLLEPDPSARRSPGASGGGSGRSSVRVRKSPAPKTTAENAWTSVRGVERGAAPASRTSISAPLGRCTPCRLAGSVAASFAITRSPGRRKSTNRDRGACVMRPSASTTSSLASRGRWTGRWAAIMQRVSSRPRRCATAAASATGQRAAIASASSRAAVSGRLSVAGSASGTASACSGVSMSPGSSDRNANAFGGELLVPDAAHVMQRGLARAVRAPLRIRVDRGVARDVEHDASAALARRRASAPSSALVRRNGPSTLVASASSRSSHSVSASSASGAGPRLDALFTSTSRPPRLPTICSAIGWMSSFRATSPTMPCAPGCARATASTRSRGPRDERHARAAAQQLADEREPETRRAAGDGGSHAVEACRCIAVKVMCHESTPCSDG